MGKNLQSTLEEYKIKIVNQLKERIKASDKVATGDLVNRDIIHQNSCSICLEEYKQKRVAYFTAKYIGVLGFQGAKFIDYVNNNIIASLTKDVEESYLKDINEQLNGNSKSKQ